MNNAPAKIQMIRSSIKCFAFGLLGLLPIIGLPFALAALWISGRVRVKEKKIWNAARPYRIWGMICAIVGTVLWAGILVFIVGNLLIFAYISG
jgi:hypothetical protein